MHNSLLEMQPITRDHRQVHPMHRQRIHQRLLSVGGNVDETVKSKDSSRHTHTSGRGWNTMLRTHTCSRVHGRWNMIDAWPEDVGELLKASKREAVVVVGSNMFQPPSHKLKYDHQWSDRTLVSSCRIKSVDALMDRWVWLHVACLTSESCLFLHY